MSKTLSQTIDPQVLADFGGEMPAIQRDELDEKIAALLGSARGQLAAAQEETRTGTREIARRAGVSAPAVSRQLKSDRDLRFSTAVILAFTMGKKWELTLLDDRPQQVVRTNYFATPTAVQNAPMRPTLSITPSGGKHRPQPITQGTTVSNTLIVQIE